MTFFLILLLIYIIYYLFRAPIQAWLAMQLVRRVQRRMGEAMGAQQRTQRPQGGYRREEGFAEGGQEPQDERSSHSQKEQLDAIEARKFARSSSDEYVDFEELP